MKKSRQQVKKKVDGKCFFCGETEYALLDCHRIFEGKEGGTYHPRNTLTSCANCHRRCHGGLIKVDKKYLGTSGRWVVHYWEDGEEKWKPE